MDGWEAAAQTVRIETSPTGRRAVDRRRDADLRRGRPPPPERTSPAQANGVKYVRVTILSTQGPSEYRDISEFGVYSAAPPDVTPTPTPTPTPMPRRPRSRRPHPTRPRSRPPPPRRFRRWPPTPAPIVDRAREAAVHAPVLRQARAQGPRRCPTSCAVRAELKVDAKTAKRLGSGRTVGDLQQDAGRRDDKLHRQLELEGQARAAAQGHVVQGDADRQSGSVGDDQRRSRSDDEAGAGPARARVSRERASSAAAEGARSGSTARSARPRAARRRTSRCATCAPTWAGSGWTATT